MNITVFGFSGQLGEYDSEQAAIGAAIDYSYDTGHIATLEYSDGLYSYTSKTREGWQLGPTFTPRRLA
jgi:hypothetical protein